MRWFKPNLRNSLHALFGTSAPSPPTEIESVFSLDDIRAAMLELLPEDEDERTQIVRRRIRFADNAEALWFLRGELMAVLARTLTESAALDRIAGISDMFADRLPRGLRSRPSPLGRS
jgi:hypothetical protein